MKLLCVVLGSILVVSVIYAEEDTLGAKVATLVLRDEMDLQNLIVYQNAKDAPLKTRALTALHWFRRLAQPSNGDSKWREQLEKLEWLRADLIQFRRAVGTGSSPNDNGASKTLIEIDVISQQRDGNGWRIYIGFSDNYDGTGTASEFLRSSTGKVVYLGLIHDSGLWENYTEKNFWISYTSAVNRESESPESGKGPSATPVPESGKRPSATPVSPDP